MSCRMTCNILVFRRCLDAEDVQQGGRPDVLTTVLTLPPKAPVSDVIGDVIAPENVNDVPGASSSSMISLLRENLGGLF